MLIFNKIHWLSALLILSACGMNQHSNESLQSTQFGPFKHTGYSLARLDSVQGFLDSLRSLPKADSTAIRRLLASGNLAYTPNETIDTVTSYHRYATLKIGRNKGEIIAMITEFNTVVASLQLMLLDAKGEYLSTVPLAYYYDEAGGKENWSSIQTTPTSFLQSKEGSDFIYANPSNGEGETGDPVGRGNTLVHIVIETRDGQFYPRQIDSTYRETKF